MTDSYDDIINMPHHVSTSHPHMPVHDRAAQFSPFAVLTGHNEAVKETARLTEEPKELDENAKAALDLRLRILQEQVNEHPEITIIYYRPDGKKAGGSYITADGCLRKIDSFQHTVTMQNGTVIPIDEIIDITGDIFNIFENF